MRRPIRIEMRLSKDEHEAWKEQARRDERTLSDYIRRVVNTSLSDADPHHGSVTHVGANGWMQSTPPEPVPPTEWPEQTVVVMDEAMTLTNEEMQQITSLKKPSEPERSGESESDTAFVKTGDRVQPPVPPEGFSNDDLGPTTFAVEKILDDRPSEGLHDVGGGEPGTLPESSGPPLAPFECSNAPFHIKGRFCNYCKEVV